MSKKENDMLGRAVRQLVRLPGNVLGLAIDLLTRLPNAEFQEKLRRSLRGEPHSAPSTRPMRILSPISQKGGQVRFVACKTFFAKTAVKIASLGDGFTAWFRHAKERPAIRAYVLTCSANDSEIIADLGGEQAVEVTLSQVWQLLQLQPEGQDGEMNNNGLANLFYVRDKGTLCVISAHWTLDGWDVDAKWLGYRYWEGGCRVFAPQLSKLRAAA